MLNEILLSNINNPSDREIFHKRSLFQLPKTNFIKRREFLRTLFFLETALYAELENDPGDSKYDCKNKETNNG